jgi:hypothetical protein
VQVALARGSVYHNEDAAGVNFLWIIKPDEDYKVRPHIALEQGSPVLGDRPLDVLRPMPVVFTAMRTFREPFAAMRSTAGAFIMPPVLTLPAVHPRTNNLAWTMSSPADPIACAI